MEKIIKAVADVTGVPAAQIIAKRGNIDTQEARMIFILLSSSNGYSDYKISYFLHRSQGSVWKTRKYAKEYGDYSASFLAKYRQAQEACMKCKGQVN